MRITKKLLSMILAVVMVLGLLPAVALATNVEVLQEGTVYMSVSFNGIYKNDQTGKPMAYVPVSFDELATIDLDAYGLADYLYDADGDGSYEITALHLIIYAHENLYGGSWSEVNFSGTPGSTYFAGGLFGQDENLNYYLNGAYPLESESWGATSDHIVLQPGDFIDLAGYSCWGFYGDEAFGFQYFADENDEITHTYTAQAGDATNIKLIKGGASMGGDYSTAFLDIPDCTVYYGTTLYDEIGSVTTDADGCASITFTDPGTYYLWVNGGQGTEGMHDWCDSYFSTGEPCVVSSPAFATVNVPDLEFNLDLSDLTAPIYDGGMIAYNLNEADFAYLDDTCEAGDNVKFGFSVADYDQYILYVDFYTDSNVIGWNVNGENYFADDPGDGYVDWDLGNDCWTGYGFGYTDEDTGKEYIEFYLQLGSESAYNTAGSWDIKPVLLTDNALDAMDAIFAIYDNGEITLESGEAIRNATALYEALSDMEKEVLAYFEVTELLEEAQETYNTLLGDREAADEVEALITSIGSVDLTKEAAITAAREAYDALNDTRKAMVSNYAALTTAEEKLQQLKDAAAQAAADQAAADAVEEQIATIGTVTVFSGKKIDDARAAFDALTDTQKALVDNVTVLTAAESALTELYKHAAKADHKAIYEATGKYIAGLGTPGVGSTGGEWMVIDLIRAGQACPEGYYKNVVDFVKAEINDKEQLHRSKSTENSRIILALTAAGYDVTNVDGHNLLMGLTDMTYIPKQGVNGPIWALIAFDSHNYEIPINPNATEQATREKLIAYILEKQLADGGWDLANRAADPDMTGMAIQALAPYYKTNDAVKTAVDKALTCLSNKQMANGGFGAVDGVCTESCAQVVVALTALGIDPETDPRFVKNGVSVLDAMCLFAVEDGGFAHVPNSGVNGMATEQGQYALVSYFRFKEGKTTLYNMSDVILRSNNTGAGKVENTTDTKENAYTGALDIPATELVDKLLTQEEEKQVAAGVNISIELSVDDIGLNVSAADKALIEKSLDKNTVGLYLDITLSKKLGNAEPVKITETNGEVTVTVVVPENLRNTDSKVNRTYKVIRIHDGKTDVLDTAYDATTGKLSFQTDCFSTYALVYTDTAVTVTPSNPKTGDNTPITLCASLMVISVACMAVLTLSKKKYVK
ncbi:MAG: terpene cyclase/mutase family protein [Oscillospiraceae bacterium]|nr:terpene cyclase/mutase family protein [Oscillospiraceae bacterium]